MENYFKNKQFHIGEGRKTVFSAENGVHQDGTTPVYRDVDGTLWAISGHSHMGEVKMFSGKSMRDLKVRYPIRTNFLIGKAGEAFDGVPYPEGVQSRGSIWPFGLYICPKTHKFFAFFHNETGWAGQGTAYDSFGLCKTPQLDSDFRHIGLMHSNDEGRTWEFDRWVLSGEKPCYTESYIPDGGNTVGQKMARVNLGAGDFSAYIEEDGEYIYLFYNIIHANLEKRIIEDIDVYVARTRKRADGVMGDFVKYYNGSFCEAGNFGRETPIVKGAWHAKVLKLKDEGIYLMTSSRVNANTYHDPANGKILIRHQLQIHTSTDLVHWSKPVYLSKNGDDFGAHYCAFYPDDDTHAFEVEGNKFVCQLGGNGIGVTAHDVEFK